MRWERTTSTFLTMLGTASTLICYKHLTKHAEDFEMNSEESTYARHSHCRIHYHSRSTSGGFMASSDADVSETVQHTAAFAPSADVFVPEAGDNNGNGWAGGPQPRIAAHQTSHPCRISF